MAHRLLTAVFFILVCALVAGQAQAQVPAQALTEAEAVVAPDGAPETAVQQVDVETDPWLAGLDVATGRAPEQPVDQVVLQWQNAAPTPQARVAAVRRARLKFGLGNLSAPANAILRTNSADERIVLAELARDLAPGVPAIQMEHAKASWDAGRSGDAVRSIVAAARAVVSDLEIRVWLVENLSSSLLLVVLGSSLFFMVLAAATVFSHAAHDLGDLFSTHTPAFARFVALAALLLVPVVLGEGIVGFALGLFALGFAYGNGRQRNALVMAAVLLVIGLHPLARLATVTSTFYDREPIAKSVLSVAGGVETRADRERLRVAAPESALAAHALAYHARRNGLEDEALARLEQVATRAPSDPVMLVNRGNIEMRRGQTDAAIDYYETAAELVESPALLFNLSQAYASTFQMEYYDETIAAAQDLDDSFVGDLSSLGEAKLVADLGLPLGGLQNRLMSMALSLESEATVAHALAPGLLGQGVPVAAGAFALVMLLCLLFANRFDHSSQCGRCGHRICTRCQKTVWSDDVCEDCHHLFHNPGETDPSLRMARLQSLSIREVWIDRAWAIGSLLVPGLAGFASKRPDLAMLGLLLFGWAAAWVAWPRGLFADPMLMGSAAWLCLAVPGLLALLAYAAVLFAGLLARKNR